MQEADFPSGAHDHFAALKLNEALFQQNAELQKLLNRAMILAGLVTVRQVIDAGDEAIEAAGLNPWCINEGRAEGYERISTWMLKPPPAVE